jgi:hypothetical protein
VRPAKTQQKISGRLRSEKATRHRYAIRGYISTAAKHGISPFTAVHDALNGNAWMPPIWLCQPDLAPLFFFDLAPPAGVRGAGVLL